ncbi:MAG: hypothetical protein KDK34_20490 [Leptospiraceae bacterium]|nr:hypothetical protein [Leptospiraceae bacterium]
MAVNGVTEIAYNPAIARQARDVAEAAPRDVPRAQLPDKIDLPNQRADRPDPDVRSKPRFEPDKLVMKPSAVPLEERLSQVMSLEDVQRLLLLRSPCARENSATLERTGKIFDMRS